MPAPKGHQNYNINGEGRPKYWTKERIDKEAEALEKWMKIQGNNFIQDFCISRDYSVYTISGWDKENENFGLSMGKFKTRQQSFLFKGSLSKKLGHSMAALILSHSHDINAKTEQKIIGDATAPLSFLLQNADGNSKDLVSNG